MRGAWLVIACTVAWILGCGGEAPETPAPAEAPEAGGSKGTKGKGSKGKTSRGSAELPERQYVRDGGVFGEVVTPEGTLEVSVKLGILWIGSYSYEPPSAPYQILIVPARKPLVVLQYETTDDSGPLDVLTLEKGKIVNLLHSGGASSNLVALEQGFETRSGQCGETHIWRVTLQGDRLVEHREDQGTRDPNCIGAACPFVDVLVGGRAWTVGEILRNVNQPAVAGPQGLPLPPQAIEQGRVVVRIAERKPEITELDAVWLEVGDREFAPLGCEEGGLCEVDGLVSVLERGDELPLVFEVGEARGKLVLWAHGHYVPQVTVR